MKGIKTGNVTRVYSTEGIDKAGIIFIIVVTMAFRRYGPLISPRCLMISCPMAVKAIGTL